MTTALIISLLTNPFVFLASQMAGLSLFRQSLKGKARSILLIAVLLTLVNFGLHYFQAGYLIALLQSIILILCNRYLFRLRWRFTVILSSVSYSLLVIPELIVYALNSLISNISAVDRYTNNTFSLSSYIVLFQIIIICVLQSFRIGFTFLNHSTHSYRVGYLTTILFGLSILNTLSHAMASLSVFKNFPIQLILLSFFSTILVFIILIQLYYQKEMKEA